MGVTLSGSGKRGLHPTDRFENIIQWKYKSNKVSGLKLFFFSQYKHYYYYMHSLEVEFKLEAVGAAGGTLKGPQS